MCDMECRDAFVLRLIIILLFMQRAYTAMRSGYDVVDISKYIALELRGLVVIQSRSDKVMSSNFKDRR